MTTNANKWRITDDKDTDETHHQATSPSKKNEVNYDCSKDKKITLLKNMAEALDVCVCVLTRPPEEKDHWPLPPIKAGWHLSSSP
jgi:hypothetical protein